MSAYAAGLPSVPVEKPLGRGRSKDVNTYTIVAPLTYDWETEYKTEWDTDIKAVDPLMLGLLRRLSPHTGEFKGEKYIRKIIVSVCNKAGKKPFVDHNGNVRCVVEDYAHQLHETLMFTCHMDTQGNSDGARTIVQENWGTGKLRSGTMHQNDTSKLTFSILGGDDKAGCYVLLNMIMAGKPGTYMFFSDQKHTPGKMPRSWPSSHMSFPLIGGTSLT